MKTKTGRDFRALFYVIVCNESRHYRNPDNDMRLWRYGCLTIFHIFCLKIGVQYCETVQSFNLTGKSDKHARISVKRLQFLCKVV